MTESWGFEEAAVSGMEIYNRVFRPSLFDPWAAYLADELAIGLSEAVLDVGCGPGSVTEVVATRVGSAGRVVGVDLSPAMLELARARPAPPGAAIEYLEGPADALPVPDGEFDVVTCQQCLQFLPDRPAAMREMHRVLDPGGRVGIAVWTDIEQSPPFAALAGALDEIDPELGARYRSGPWGLTDQYELLDLVTDAGFTNASWRAQALPWRIKGGAEALFSTLRASGVAQDVEALPPDALEHLADAVDRRVGALIVDGDIMSEATSAIVTGVR